MTEFIQFAILGLGPGAVYALLAIGIVLIYRGSGLVNFAHGGFAMIAAYVGFVTLNQKEGLPLGVALAAAVVLAAVIGVLFQVLVLNHLRRAASLVRVIATLGLLVMMQAFTVKEWSGIQYVATEYLPDGLWNVGDVVVQQSRVSLLAIAVFLTAVLWAFTRFTTVGLAISASAQGERSAAALGWSPNLLAAITWAIGGGLAGLAGVLIAPLAGLTPITFTTVATFSLAAALLGGFKSFWLTLVGGVFLGILESVMTRYQTDVKDFFGLASLTGAPRALPFIVIVIVLVVRGQNLPLRSIAFERLPSLGTGRIRAVPLVIAVGVTTFLALSVMDARWLGGLTATLCAAIFLTSIVVLTGLAGQLSLAQFAIGGIGALIAAQLVAYDDFPLQWAALTAIVLTIPVGVIFAIPALRTRGMNLAIVTLGLAFAVESVIFNDPYYTGNDVDGGTPVGSARLFGFDVDAIKHPERWALVCLAGFVLVAVAAANLRRSPWGRRLIAVRTNERAAASLGIGVFGAKIYAFAVAAAMAAVGGILIGFQNPLVTYGSFTVFSSIQAVGLTVIGGIGWIVGSAFGGFLTSGGLAFRFTNDVLEIGEWLTFLTGALIIIQILVNPNGIAEKASQIGRRILRVTGAERRAQRRAERRATILPPAQPADAIERVTPVSLVVEGLTVRFGGVTAVDDVSLTVAPGEVVGLIGPNGAGKTTCIDAITGFVKPSAGTLSLGGQSIGKWSAARRARAGLRRSFQSLELFEDITVAENLHSGAEELGRFSWLTNLVYPRRRPLPPTAVTAVHDFALVDDLDRLPGELSYGSRRLVAIARAVASAPSVLLLDEPAAGLDTVDRRELAVLVRSLAEERGMGILIVEHDVSMVLSICDRIVVLDFGQKIAEGTPAEIEADPAVLAAYLGEEHVQRATDTGVPEGSDAPTPV